MRSEHAFQNSFLPSIPINIVPYEVATIFGQSQNVFSTVTKPATYFLVDLVYTMLVNTVRGCRFI